MSGTNDPGKQIPASLNEISEAVAALQSSVRCLVEQIDMVLLPSEPTVSEKLMGTAKGKGSQTRLSEVLDTITEELRDIQRSIDDACERVEL